MRLISTPESIALGDITLLSILECVLATSIYFALCRWQNSLLPFQFAICVAPLFLFRSEYSYKYCLSNFNNFLTVMPNFDDKNPISSFFKVTIAVIILIVYALFNRFKSTIVGILFKPLETARAIPSNWFRNAFSVDLASPPEITPGEATLSHGFSFSELLSAIKDCFINHKSLMIPKYFTPFALIFVLLPITILGYIPAIFARISYKASAFIYLPMIYLIQSTVNRKSSAQVWLKDIVDGALEKSRRWLAGITMAFVAGKIALNSKFIPFDLLPEYAQKVKLLENIMRDPDWHLWQIPWIADALLTFAMLGFADMASRRVEGPGAISETTVSSVLSTLAIVRGIAAAVAILFTFGASLLGVLQALLLA